MSAGRTALGRRRERARRKLADRIGAMPLLRARDYDAPVHVAAEDVGERSTSTTWAETFLDVNRSPLARLGIRGYVATGVEGLSVVLQPSALIGAVPLLAPSTRKVAAGLVIGPRFGWSAVGSLLGDVAFRVEPQIGGLPMVPGSAREVPPWILAGPVLTRIATLIDRLSRAFTTRTEDRSIPRGSVDWSHYARVAVPRGAWTTFRCTYSDLELDPWLVAASRWTVERMRDELAKVQSSAPAYRLLTLARSLLARLGEGPSRRPAPGELAARATTLLGESQLAALEAVGWVSEERGLGGARVLDGLSWSLSGDALWEAWVESFVRDLAARVGAVWLPRGETRQRLRWETRLRSLESLEPDLGFRTPRRAVWVDAKYKFHLTQLGAHGWDAAGDATRAAHRADVHQALAYANLADLSAVDTVLAYPLDREAAPQLAVAHVPAGRRQVRLILAGLPFGFASPAARAEALGRWQGVVG